MELIYDKKGKNSRGPSTDPCGTPDTTEVSVDDSP